MNLRTAILCTKVLLFLGTLIIFPVRPYDEVKIRENMQMSIMPNKLII